MLHAVDVAAFELSAEGIERCELAPGWYVDKRGRRWRSVDLTAPRDFRFQSNPDGVLRFIYELRRQVFAARRFAGVGSRKHPGMYVSLDEIEQLDLDGALILAAELDRVRLVMKFKPILDDGRWSSEVRAILYALGLHRVINAGRISDAVPIDDFTAELAARGLVVMPFQSDAEAAGAKARDLRDSIYEACEPPESTRRPIYDSLFEALLNAVQHAYPTGDAGDGLPGVRRWWAGALVDKKDGYLYFVVYDQGVGIPATLPARPWWSILKGQLPELTDAAIIEGSLEYGRSGAGADGRGNGLWRMCALTDAFDEADVRFTSSRGQVDYVKGGSLQRVTLKSRFCGTLIRWRAKVGTQETPR
jgi:hypothetical protein